MVSHKLSEIERFETKTESSVLIAMSMGTLQLNVVSQCEAENKSKRQIWLR